MPTVNTFHKLCPVKIHLQTLKQLWADQLQFEFGCSTTTRQLIVVEIGHHAIHLLVAQLLFFLEFKELFLQLLLEVLVCIFNVLDSLSLKLLILGRILGRVLEQLFYHFKEVRFFVKIAEVLMALSLGVEELSHIIVNSLVIVKNSSPPVRSRKLLDLTT